MPVLFARYRVDDLAAWRKAFDGNAESRRDHGLTVKAVYRDATYINGVIVVYEAEDLDRAHDFYHSDDQRERKYTLFNLLVSLFERAYILVYEDKMDRQTRRLWLSWEDYMREWCRRKDFRDVLPELLRGEDEDFAAHIGRIAEIEANRSARENTASTSPQELP